MLHALIVPVTDYTVITAVQRFGNGQPEREYGTTARRTGGDDLASQ